MRAIKQFSFGLTALVAARLAAQPLPPPVDPGVVDIEVTAGVETRTVQHDYLPPSSGSPYVIFAESIGSSSGGSSGSRYARTIVTTTVIPAVAGDTTTTFLLDYNYSAKHPEVIRPVGDWNAGLGDWFAYSKVTKKTSWDPDGQVTYELQARRLKDSSIEMIKGDGLGAVIMSFNTPSFWATKFDSRYITRVSGDIGALQWGSVSARVWRYLPGIQDYFYKSQPDGSDVVFNLNHYTELNGAIRTYYPIGKLTQAGTPGHAREESYDYRIEWLDSADTYTSLKNESLTFPEPGDFQIATDPTASYQFSPSAASVTKLRYKLGIQPGIARTITWAETFTPDGASAPTDYRFMSEPVTADATETSAFIIDPFDTANPHRFGPVSGTYRILTFEAALTVDANRDGVILPAVSPITPYRIANADVTTAEHPFRFWLNDDDDSGDTGGDDISKPGSNVANATQDIFDGLGKVDGNRDLIDFFPVFLDIKPLITALPPSLTVKYKLKQADGAVNFVYTNLTRDQALNYQTKQLSSGFGDTLNQAPGVARTRPIPDWGVDLFEHSPAFLDAVQNQNGGVILVEGRKSTDKPLVLSVEKTDGTVIAEIKLHLKISPMEEMFRHLNLREGTDKASGLIGQYPDDQNGKISRMDNPVDAFPDTGPDQSWYIFVVGSNVGGQNARGWESEAFKRLYWSKSKARFLGVSWFGDPYETLSENVYDYHYAVRNAFATAPTLASRVNGLQGNGSKTIAGHSLSCGLIAEAIAHNEMNVTHAILCDAAVARETFDGRVGTGDQLNTEELGMTPAIWRNYDPRFFATNWHEHFASITNDNRQNITWRNHFVNAAPKVHSFYSSTEDALGEYEGEVPTNLVGALIAFDNSVIDYVWVYQEKAKGNRQYQGLPFLFNAHAGSTYMGWGMNLKDPFLSGDPTHWKWVKSPSYIGRMIKTSAELSSVSESVLRRHPVFEPGWGKVLNQQERETPITNFGPVEHAPDWICDLYQGTSGNSLAAVSANKAQLLAEAIPALTWAVGSHETEAFEVRNYKLTDHAASGWPRGQRNGVYVWRHSDLRDVAYLYQSKLWDKFVSISENQ